MKKGIKCYLTAAPAGGNNFQIYIGVNLKIWGANVSSLQYLIYIKTIFLEPTMVTWCVLALSADTQVDERDRAAKSFDSIVILDPIPGTWSPGDEPGDPI